MIGKLRKKLNLVTALLCSIYLIVPNTYAFNLVWHPVVSLGVGASGSANAGVSQNFPVENPTTDSFYNYSANQHMQTVGMFDVFFGGESAIFPQWLIQTGIDYIQTSSYSAKGTLVQGADLPSSDTYAYQYRIQTTQLLAEAKLLYTCQNLHPYAMIGIGSAFNNAYHFGTTVPPTLTFTRNYLNNTQTSFSYLLGIGIDKDITKNMRVGIGYRFTDLGKVKLGNATIDTTPVSGTLTQSHLQANQLVAQLTWVAT